MKILNPVSDYIQRSILTTKGDMVVRGDAIPERLAAAAIPNFLCAKGAGAIPAWEQYGYLVFWVGTPTFDPTDGSTVYFSNSMRAVSTTASNVASRLFISGTIVAASVTAYSNGGNRSTEPWSLYVTTVGGGEELIFTDTSPAPPWYFGNYSMSFAIDISDPLARRICLKLVNPTWTNNPVLVSFGGYLLLRFTDATLG
jgi:hypothetical protein